MISNETTTQQNEKKKAEDGFLVLKVPYGTGNVEKIGYIADREEAIKLAESEAAKHDRTVCYVIPVAIAIESPPYYANIMAQR